MKQKLMLVCLASFSILSAVTFAHPNASHSGRSDTNDFNWGDGPSSQVDRNDRSSYSVSSHLDSPESSRSDFNWGNGPSNFNWGDGPSKSNMVHDASNFNWGNGPN